MPKLDSVLNLINAVGQRNYRRARRSVEVMIANERDNKHEQSANQLEYALKHWPQQEMIELPKDISNLVWTEKPERSLDSLYLNPSVRAEVLHFLAEREKADEIRQAGLSLTNKILLAGPPGNGKTSLAEALANSLRLIFLPIKMHTVVESYLGVTGKNLGKLFDYTIFNNALVFIDELDAIGSGRSIDGERISKEYNTIVNTLLMSLDRLPDTSIFIGATNLPEAIDPALERRFGLKLWLDNPLKTQIYQYLKDYQENYSINLFAESLMTVVHQLAGSPWSRIEEFCVRKHKSIILGEAGDSSAVAWVGR